MPALLIGQLSKETGCKIETIRYYEKIGLLAEPQRTTGGHRLFEDEQLKRLTFIRRCRELGFTLDNVRDFLTLVDDDSITCGEVESLTREHLNEIEDKIKDLKAMKKVLAEMLSQCPGGTRTDCPIMDALYKS